MKLFIYLAKILAAKIIEKNTQITIKDIATKAKVSIGTVDRVLHNRGEVAENTRRKINEIIKEFDYQPNILARALASKKTVVFSTLFPEPLSPEGYWNKPMLGVKKRISELNQYGIKTENFTFRQSDPKDFAVQSEKILELKPDGVVLAPFFSKEACRFVNILNDRKIPFVFLDSEIKNAGQISFVGQNSYQSGYLAGKLMDLTAPAHKQILVIHFAKEMDNQNHLTQREAGFHHWFSFRHPEKPIKTFEIGNMDNRDWETGILCEIENKNTGGIFVTNSKVFLVARFLENRNINNISVIGYDLLRENKKFLKQGAVSFLICQRPEEQGYNAVNMLFKHIVQKKQVRMEDYTPIDIITKENVDFYKEFKIERTT